MKREIKWIILVSGALITVLLFRGFVFSSYLIPSSGMENALFRGDRILVDKWSYGLRLPFMSLFSYHRWGYSPMERGDIAVFNNPAETGKAIDRADLFICRCVGSPGDTLFVDSLFTIQPTPGSANPNKKRLYSYPAEKEIVMKALLTRLVIPDMGLMGHDNQRNIRSFSRYEYYLLEQELNNNNWITPMPMAVGEIHTLVVPRKDKEVDIHPWNITLVRNTIVLHEGKQAEIRNDSLYMEGKAVTSYTFGKDYYWMSSDNTLSLSDSRLFGFVPHDHLIGKATRIWFSKESGNLFGGYRWERFFSKVK